MFKNRMLLVATKHKKEQVIAPILEKELGVKCIVSRNFDTDILGTFTGEVERKDNPITTLRSKCLLAMELENCDLAIASEGSFGAHPDLIFASVNEEFLLFMDKKNNLEIIVRELSTETNFNAAQINSENELRKFAQNVQFPSHGLIIRKHKDDFTLLKKGITDWETLIETYIQIRETDGSAYVETDMRALYNPTRMRVIKKATQKLVKKINSLCPQCQTAGFDIVKSKEGLPCECCNNPTRSTLSFIYVCQTCSYTEEKFFPNNKTTEKAMYCNICNP